MITLRPYQQEATDAALTHIKSKKPPAIVVLPTGSGKSIVIAAICKELTGPTLVLQPSKEILAQNLSKFQMYAPEIPVGVFSASFGKKQVNHVTFAMIGSIFTKLELFTGFQNIIIDECHLVNPKGGMYNTLLKYLTGKSVIGLTATPYRLASNRLGSILRFITRTNPKIFTSVIYHVQVNDLAKEGFLSKMDYYPVSGFDSSKVKLNSTKAEYEDKSLQRYMREINFPQMALHYAGRLCKKRKSVLVFTRFTDEAKYVVNGLKNEYEAAIVSADTPPKERDRILKDFKSGEIKLVANVGVLTTGFDFPELECVLLARPTRSLALYYQMVGRGIRPHKDKESCWVVDMCENVKRFGHVEGLWLMKDEKGQWIISGSNGEQLTNVYMD